MTLKKKILKSQVVMVIVAKLITSYIWLVYRTSRWEVVNTDIFKDFEGKPIIFAFWHGRLLMIPPFAPKWAKVNVIVSHHSDGELVDKVQKTFGFNTIRGSSSKGGTKVLRKIIAAVKNNEVIAITPDGPRGPAQKVGGHSANISRMFNIPIIPIAYSFKNARRARSWDSFVIAHPFGKGVFVAGNPLLPHESDRLEEALNEVTNKADELAANH